LDLTFLKEFKIDQIGIVVQDIDTSIMQFNKLLGISNFEIMVYPDKNKIKDTFYYGEPANFSIKVGFTKLVNLELELIQPLSGESIYKDFLLEKKQGLHHFRISVSYEQFENICSHMKMLGIEKISQGPGVRSKSKWAVFGTRKYLGTDFEIKSI
jgi:methylmalonyl-CoA/ethylmalonyl-CoA epimerase